MVWLRHLVSLLLLVLAVAVLLWIAQRPQSMVKKHGTDNADWFVHQLTTKQFDKNGKVRYIAKADSWHHYDASNRVSITEPHITLFDQTQYPWILKAHYGEIATTSFNNPAIRLWNQVLVHQPPDKTHDDITATTDILLIYPASHYAQTDEPITIKQNNNILKSVGLQVFLNEKKVQLLNEVKAYYATTS